jgi:predicted Zn-dependent peptidase
LSERYFQHTLASGLTLLAEEMPGVQSAAMVLMLAAGSASDPAQALGSASVLSDLVLRGAGARDSRQLSDYLDSLGLHRSSSVGVHHARFACEGLAPKVVEALAAYADIVRRPHLPPSGFQAARDLALQSLEGLEDDPRQKLVVKLRECFFPSPLGRNPMGKPAHLRKLTLEVCKADWQRRYQAKEAILAVAGNIDFAQVKSEVQKHFGQMAATGAPVLAPRRPRKKYHHEIQRSEQTHIGIAYPSIEETDQDYYVVRLAMEILGGGMSGRLFTEVREKRGLCYAVWAGYTGIKGYGAVLGYAGTSNDRAQATLDCMAEQIHRLAEGVSADELQRAKIVLKANTIMDGESTAARAGAIAYDFFMRGRMRTLDEITAQIDAVDLERINDFLRRHRPGPFTIVTVGPKELRRPGE